MNRILRLIASINDRSFIKRMVLFGDRYIEVENDGSPTGRTVEFESNIWFGRDDVAAEKRAIAEVVKYLRELEKKISSGHAV